jgi:hypothetical protein
MVLAEESEHAAVTKSEAGRIEPANIRLCGVRPGERAGIEEKRPPLGIDRDAGAGLEPPVHKDRAAGVGEIGMSARPYILIGSDGDRLVSRLRVKARTLVPDARLVSPLAVTPEQHARRVGEKQRVHHRYPGKPRQF